MLSGSLTVSWLERLLLESLGLLRLRCGRIVHTGSEELRGGSLLLKASTLVKSWLRSLLLRTTVSRRGTVDLLDLSGRVLTTT